MKKYSSIVVAFCVFAVLLFWLDSYLLAQPSIYKKKQELCITKAKKAKVLILGSSHALFGIRPDQLSQPAINLSNVSQSLDLDEKLLQKLLKDNFQFKLVVLPVSYFSLEESLTGTTEEWRDCLYFRYLGISERSLSQAWFDPRYWSLPFLYRSYLTSLPNMRDDYTLASYRISEDGWVANDRLLSAKQAEAMGQERARLFESFMKPETLELHKQILQRMISLCSLKHLKVLLVTMPAANAFRKYADVNRVSELKSFLSSSTVPNQVAYADYWSDKRFVLSDFADTDHLNSSGGAKFSRLLDQEFIRPMLASR